MDMSIPHGESQVNHISAYLSTYLSILFDLYLNLLSNLIYPIPTSISNVGVLQYFSVSYCVTACTVLYMKKTTDRRIDKIKEVEKVEDERTNMWQLHQE
jgi:hypothetical protein